MLEGRLPSGDVVARETCWLVVLGEGRFRRTLETNPRLEHVLRRIAIESVEASGPGERDVAMLQLPSEAPSGPMLYTGFGSGGPRRRFAAFFYGFGDSRGGVPPAAFTSSSLAACGR